MPRSQRSSLEERRLGVVAFGGIVPIVVRRTDAAPVAGGPVPLVGAARAAAACGERVPDGPAGGKRRLGCAGGIAEPLAGRRRAPLTDRTPDSLRRSSPCRLEEGIDAACRAVVVQGLHRRAEDASPPVQPRCRRQRRMVHKVHGPQPSGVLNVLGDVGVHVHLRGPHARTGRQATSAVPRVTACTASTSITQSVQPPVSQNTDGSTPPRLPPR